MRLGNDVSECVRLMSFSFSFGSFFRNSCRSQGWGIGVFNGIGKSSTVTVFVRLVIMFSSFISALLRRYGFVCNGLVISLLAIVGTSCINGIHS